MKTNVTIFLEADVLDRCRQAAAEDNRSLSNYLSGILERAHPVCGKVNTISNNTNLQTVGDLKRAAKKHK